MTREELLESVLGAVHELEPDAEVILYGSRARGDADPDSDWDFLILVDGPVDEERKTKIRHRLYEIEWQEDEVINPIVDSREEWNSPRCQITPFCENVHQDGIRI